MFCNILKNKIVLGSGSVDPHIFADQDHDPGSRNLAYLTDPDPDPDPKHCFIQLFPPFFENNFFYHRVKNACLEH